MRIAHISDLHALELSGVSPLRFFNKRFVGAINLWRKRAQQHPVPAPESARALRHLVRAREPARVRPRRARGRVPVRAQQHPVPALELARAQHPARSSMQRGTERRNMQAQGRRSGRAGAS